jgi:hypothetical protein
MDCGEVINLFTICDQTVHLDGSDQACVNKWYTEVLNYPCVNPPYTLTTITSSNINSLGLSEEIKTLIQSQPYWPAACDCNTPTFFHLSGSQYNCDCCPSTTTTFNPNTSTTQPPFSCCGHVILKFKTFTIPDCLNVYSSGNSLLYSTGFISTGDEFVTIDLFNLPCGFYMCVDAPASGTLWELDVSGIPYGTGVGMYCPVFQVSGGQNIYDIPYCFSS